MDSIDTQQDILALQAEVQLLRRRVAELEQVQTNPELDVIQAMMGTQGAGLVITNNTGEWVFVNQGFADMLGYDLEELRQMRFSQITHPDNQDESNTFFERLINGVLDQYRFEKRYIHRQGHSINARVTLTRFESADSSTFISAVIENITELKKTQEQLAQRQSLVEVIIDNLPGLFYVIDLDGRLLRWNDNLEKVTGYSFEECHLTPILEFFRPENQEKVRTIFPSTIEKGTGHVELEIILKNGDMLPYLFSGSLVTLDGSECIIGTAMDISELKVMEAALRRSEELARNFEESLRALYTASVELSRVHTLDDLHRAAVEQAITTLGFDRFSLWTVDADLKMAYGTYGTDEFGNLLDEHYFNQTLPNTYADAQLFEEAEGMIIRQSTKLSDAVGNFFGQGWNINAVIKEEGRVLGFISCDNLVNGRPLTDQQVELLRLYCVLLGPLIAGKSSQEALQRSEESWRTLVQNAPDIISMIDREYRIQFHNQMALVKSADDPLGHSVLEYALPEYHETMIATFKQAFQTDEPGVYEFQGLDEKGRPAWYSTRVSPVKVGGEINSLILIARDITEMRYMDEQRMELQIEREKTRLLSGFINSASHEFRNPLSVINSSTYVLRRVDDPERKETHLQRIEEQVDGITRLLNHLITMSRLDSGVDITFSELNMNDIATSLSHAMTEQVQEKNLAVKIALDPDIPMLFGATSELYQAALNMLENAIKHSPQNGMIHIRTRHDNKYVVLEIQDQGPGIPKESLPHIFERFYRADAARSTRGFGLGLSISKSIVDLHSGDIQVFSKDGEGTLVCLLLPVEILSLPSIIR